MEAEEEEEEDENDDDDEENLALEDEEGERGGGCVHKTSKIAFEAAMWPQNPRSKHATC